MRRAETIVSAANPLVKDVRRAIARGGQTAEGLSVAESFHLLEEALASDCEVKHVLAAESVYAKTETYLRRRPGVHVVAIDEKLFQNLAATGNSQGVIALVKLPEWNLDRLWGSSALVVILDGLQDPGNAGSIVRAAEAFEATGVMFLKGAASPYNPKTLRASAGSLFRVPFVQTVDAAVPRAALLRRGVQVFASAPARAGDAGHSPASADLARSCAIVIGNEARGVSGEWRSMAQDLSIPTARVESLNAAVAAGILLYEAHRQRAGQP